MRAAVCTCCFALFWCSLYFPLTYLLENERFQICDMVTVARLLNLTLVVPELDKQSFWADPRYFYCSIELLTSFYSYLDIYFFLRLCYFTCSNFEDIFDLRHFIDSLRDEVRIVKRLPKRFNRRYGFQPLEMPPVSWSNEKYYLEQVRL